MTPEHGSLRDLVSRWAGGEHVRHLNTWNSRTARITLWNANGDQLLVKELETPDLAARLHDTMDAFADAVPPEVRRLRPLGWAREPPCVCMPYVPAPSLARLIRRRWLWWKAPPIGDIVASVGTALACFHRALGRADELSRDDADHTLSLALEAAAPYGETLRAAADSAEPVRVYDDINPSHVLVDASTITLIDIPDGDKIAYPHRDLAWFTDQLFMALLRSVPNVPASRQLSQLAALRQRLLRAYFSEAGRPPTEGDDCLVAAFEAYYLARRRSRGRSPIASGLLGPPLRIRSQRLRSAFSS